MKECPSCKKPIEIETECCECCGLVFAKWEAKNKPLDEKEVEKEIEAARLEFRREQDKKTIKVTIITVSAVLLAAVIWFVVRPPLPGFERQMAEDFVKAIKNADIEKIKQLTNEQGIKSINKYGPLSEETLKFISNQIPENYEIASVEISVSNPAVNLKGTGTAEGSTGRILFSYEGVLLKVSGQEWEKMEGGFVVLPAYNRAAELAIDFDEKSDPDLKILPVPGNILKEKENFNRKLVRAFYKKDGSLKAIKTISAISNAKIVFSSDGKYLLAASALDSRIKIWKTSEWSLVKELEQEFRTESVAAAPDGSAFIIGDTYEHCIIIPLDEKGPKNTFRLTVDLGGSMKVGMSGNSKIIATGSAQKTFSLWEYPDNVRIMKTSLPFEITDIDLSETAPYLAAASSKNMFAFWDLRTGQGVTFTVPKIASGVPVTTLAISPNGKYVLTGYKDGNIALTDMERYRIKYVISSGTTALAVRFSADGKVFAAAKTDSKVNLWDTDTGRKLDTLKGHTGRVQALAFSPAGNYLVSAGEDNKIIVWGYEEANSKYETRNSK